MRKFWGRLLTAARIMTAKNVIVIDVASQVKENRLAVTLWTTIDSEESQIEYLDAMAKELKYERQQHLEKVRKFMAVNN